MARAVLLDLDDTLSDHTHCSVSALAAVCADVPALAVLPFVQVQADHALLLEELHLEVLRGALTLDASRVERFRRLLRQYRCDDDPERAAACYRAAYQTSRRPVPGAVALLEELRGRAAVAVVTNNLQAEQEEKLQTLGIAHLVDALVTSEAAGVAKPDPAIFHVALRRLGYAPAKAVMLGDSWSADVLGVRAAGVRAVWLNRHGYVCLDPTLAVEITSLEPTGAVATVLLDG